MFFPESFLSIWELKTYLRQNLIWRKTKLLPPHEKSHGLGTQRESCQKQYGVFPRHSETISEEINVLPLHRGMRQLLLVAKIFY